MDYEWWVEKEHANCQDLLPPSSLHKPAPAEEAGVLSNGNWDYWDRRRQADVEEVPGRASEKQMSRL